MNKQLATIIFALIVFTSVISQQKQAMNCGTITTDLEIALLKKNIKQSKSYDMRSMETILVPIQFHLVATNEGNGRIQPLRVFESLCKLNEDFENTNLQFYFNGEFKNINSSAMYDMNYPPIPPGVNTQFVLKKVNGSINVFVGNGLTTGSSGFYTSSTDIIYMDKRYMTDGNNILAHEVGHFLGLPHTFFGWEETTYDPDSPTPIEVFRGSFSYKVEYVDRTINCEDSGDFFCGTPADYILDWNGDCNYTGGAVDPDSVLLDPDETNIMSYYSFSGCEKFIFAEDQSAAMLANHSNRSQLQSGNIMPLNEVSGPPELISPLIDEDIPVNNVVIEWSKPENATHFLVELGRLPNFVALDVQEITTETSMEIQDLKADKKYYWHVYAFNKTEICDIKVSERGNFSTIEMASDVNELVESNAVSIYPNPITIGRVLQITSDRELGSSTIDVFNIQGKKVQSLNMDIIRGVNSLNDLSLSAGTYFIKITSSDYAQAIKLIVL